MIVSIIRLNQAKFNVFTWISFVKIFSGVALFYEK
jgi:hypothetical protein